MKGARPRSKSMNVIDCLRDELHGYAALGIVCNQPMRRCTNAMMEVEGRQ